MEILWLSLVAIPVLALIALWEHRFSKGKVLESPHPEWWGDQTTCFVTKRPLPVEQEGCRFTTEFDAWVSPTGVMLIGGKGCWIISEEDKQLGSLIWKCFDGKSPEVRILRQEWNLT